MKCLIFEVGARCPSTGRLHRNNSFDRISDAKIKKKKINKLIFHQIKLLLPGYQKVFVWCKIMDEIWVARHSAKRVVGCFRNAAGRRLPTWLPAAMRKLRYLDTHTSSAGAAALPAVSANWLWIDPVCRFPFLPCCTLDVTPFISRRASHSPLTRRWIGVRCRVRARRSAIERQRECCFLPVCAETCSSGAQRRSRASCVSAHRLGGKGQSARLQAIRAPSAWLSLSSSLELQALHVWLHERAPASVFSSEYANIHTFQRSLISQAAFPLPTELLKT